MRQGQNPAKFVESVPQPQTITVAVVTYIPFLSGYYAQGLEVLKACLGSLWQNTDLPYDLMVFDNASCAEVRAFLSEAHQGGKIQYLILADRNMGKAGAWNVVFGAAPGQYLAYADADIYFHAGWLKPQLEALEALPNVGMVTGMPLRTPEQFSTATVAWAEGEAGAAAGVTVQRGQILPWEDYRRHAHSLGLDDAEARRLYDNSADVCLTVQGKRYYVGAGHFQFTAPTHVLRSVLPIPSRRPMGQVRLLDIAINEKGYLRLSTPQWWIHHMGNTLENQPSAAISRQPASRRSGFFQWKPVRRLLLGLYGRIFDIYFRT